MVLSQRCMYYFAPENSEDILNFGGIIGYTIYSNIDIIEQIIGQIELLKSLPQILSLSSTNIAIVGLAFIFELARNLLRWSGNCGVFGVTLARQGKLEPKSLLGKTIIVCLCWFFWIYRVVIDFSLLQGIWRFNAVYRLAYILRF